MGKLETLTTEAQVVQDPFARTRVPPQQSEVWKGLKPETSKQGTPHNTTLSCNYVAQAHIGRLVTT